MRGPLKTATLLVQKALYVILSNDPIINTMTKGVFDEVPEGTTFPYIQLGDDTINPYDTKTNYGEDMTVTIHVWSLGPGKTEAKTIMDVILQAVTKEPIVIPGFDVTGIQREFLQAFYDGQAYHGVCRFRIYTNQK